MAAVESETEMEGDGDSLAEGDDVAESRREAVPIMEAVPGPAVEETATEALACEAEGEGVEVIVSEATEDPVVLVVPLPLLRVLVEAAALAETLWHCETVSESTDEGDEARVGWGDVLS